MYISDKPLSANDLRKSLEVLIVGERKNQIYYLMASVLSLAVGCALIWWSSSGRFFQSGTDSAKALVNGALPLIGSALSVTRIVAAESKITQCRAAAALRGGSVEIAVKLIQMRILSTGVERGSSQH